MEVKGRDNVVKKLNKIINNKILEVYEADNKYMIIYLIMELLSLLSCLENKIKYHLLWSENK